MSPRKGSLSRTEWAERHVEDFLSLPLISEFVFRSPRTIKAGKVKLEQEVVDILVAHGEIGILLSQKCQENPVARTGPELVSWASKAAIKASSQLYGALRVPAGAEIWCDHRRRGRVQFCGGLPKINHAIALIEVFEAVDLQAGASDLPLVYNNVPISYLSLNDFLNLAVELRTTPELLEYLTARRSLPEADLRLIGDERSLFEFYLLNNGSFGGCASRADATRVVDGAKDRLQQAIQLKAEADRPAALLEHVADALATRHPANAETLSEKLLALFDPPEERKSYLELQAVITNLRLRERTELGSSFEETIRRSAVETEGLIYKAVHVHSLPDWVFVFGSSKKLIARCYSGGCENC